LKFIDEMTLTGGQNKEAAVYKLQKQIESKKGEIRKLENRMARLYEDYTNGAINRGEYADFKKNYEVQIDEAESAIENLQKEIKNLTAEKNLNDNKRLEYFREYYDFTELSRNMTVKLTDRIIVYGNGRLEIIFRCKDEYERAVKKFICSHPDSI